MGLGRDRVARSTLWCAESAASAAAIAGDLAQDVDLDAGVGEPGESGVPGVVSAKVLVPEL